MAKPRTALAKRAAKKEPAPRTLEALGPGLHAAYIELRAGGRYRARLPSGVRVAAVLGDGVEPALAEECLRAGRMVILCDTERGPTLIGALQTSRSVVREADGALSIAARTIRLKADQALVVEAGPVALRLEQSGLMRAEGEKMIIDMGSNVRVLSALVELP
jgi:hypothetical protein